MKTSLEEKLEVASQAARTAGELLLQNRFTALEKYMKGNEGDFTTQLDINTEKVIKDILRIKYPKIPIIGEETGLTGIKESKEIWFVDPLDGTKAFFQGNVAFTAISIALANSKEVLIGVVYNPFTDTLYTATKESQTLINDQPVNPRIFESKLSDSRVILDFSKNLPIRIKRALLEQEVQKTIGRIFRYEGSVAQHLCLIGSGVHHGGLFWGELQKGHFWDIGAGLLVCQQAGLILTDFNNNLITCESNNYSQILVGSPSVHAELLTLVSKISKLKSM